MLRRLILSFFIGFLSVQRVSSQVSLGVSCGLVDDSQYLLNSSFLGARFALQSSGSYMYAVSGERAFSQWSVGVTYSDISTNFTANEIGSKSVVGITSSGADVHTIAVSGTRWLLGSERGRLGLGLDIGGSLYETIKIGTGSVGRYQVSRDSTPTYVIAWAGQSIVAPNRFILSFKPSVCMDFKVYKDLSLCGTFSLYFTYSKPFYITTTSFDERYKSEDAYQARLQELSGGRYTGIGSIVWPNTIPFFASTFRDIRPMFSLGVKYTFRRKARGTPDLGT